jgi:hypothetical protein
MVISTGNFVTDRATAAAKEWAKEFNKRRVLEQKIILGFLS